MSRCFHRLRSASLTLLAVSALAPQAGSAQAVSFVGPGGEVDWNRFYTAAETNQILREFHELYPEFTEIYSIGESIFGQPLMVIEITNEATGPAAEKPALYVDGGIHAQELTGSSVATHLVGYLLNGYGSDPRITELLDTRAFYVRPKFNPDGSDLVLIEDQFMRSTPRPVDEDGDAVADEDPPEDLNRDGWITHMRYPDPDGEYVVDLGDDRIMIRDQDRELAGERYSMIREGIDNDGDGEINEDGIGGIDMNRNYPRNWERWHLQPGSGDYPLSEPETRAAVEFINANRNVTGIFHGHTSGGFVYRLPSAVSPPDFPDVDLGLIIELGEEYTRSTGRPVVPSSTHPTEHRYGTLISWGYWDQGIIGWVPEFSPGPEEWVTDYDGNGEISEAEEHRFNDEELEGRYFVDWEPYDHPDLGPVEIGGWLTKFWGQNPPPEFLEDETSQQMHWILYLAEQSPMLELTRPTVRARGDGTYLVEATVSNEGYLPTSLTDRGLVGAERPDGSLELQVVRPPSLTLELTGFEIVEGRARVQIEHLAGTNSLLEALDHRSRAVSWVVRPTGGPGAFRVIAESDKGGVVRSDWVQAP
ncbi:MAG: M14 family metallopeptidase [Gemmatimonadota bacterium]